MDNSVPLLQCVFNLHAKPVKGCGSYAAKPGRNVENRRRIRFGLQPFQSRLERIAVDDTAQPRLRVLKLLGALT